MESQDEKQATSSAGKGKCSSRDWFYYLVWLVENLSASFPGKSKGKFEQEQLMPGLLTLSWQLLYEELQNSKHVLIYR